MVQQKQKTQRRGATAAPSPPPIPLPIIKSPPCSSYLSWSGWRRFLHNTTKTSLQTPPSNGWPRQQLPTASCLGLHRYFTFLYTSSIQWWRTGPKNRWYYLHRLRHLRLPACLSRRQMSCRGWCWPRRRGRPRRGYRSSCPCARPRGTLHGRGGEGRF